MKKASTHFQAWQAQAKRNSRRLTIAFCLALGLSFVGYWLATLLFFFFFRHQFLFSIRFNEAELSNRDFFTASPIGLLVAGGFVLMILLGFWRKWQQLSSDSAIDIALSLGAKPLPAHPTLLQQQYDNVVEEMAVASGIAKPHVFYQPNNDSINAFVTGDSREHTAITVSQGALDYLSREELQALVAHEFGHIHNRDVFLNNRLTAILHGFFSVKSALTDGKDEDDDDWVFIPPNDKGAQRLHQEKQKRRGLGFSRGVHFGIFGMALLAISSGMIFCGRLLQAAFSRQREWLADAHAVQYTRNSEALVGVLEKALALQSMQVATPTFNQARAHFLFINYQNHWLSSHPTLLSRIARYGRVPNAAELSALIHRLKQNKLADEKQEQQHQHSVLAKAAPKNSEDVAQFLSQNLYPLFAIRQYQQALSLQPAPSPTVAAAAVSAQFVLLSQRSVSALRQSLHWDEAWVSLIETQINYLKQQHPTTHIEIFLHYLPTLSDYADKKTLSKQIKQLIAADKTFSLCEMSYLLCLRQTWGKKPDNPMPENQTHWQDLAPHIQPLLQTVAAISHDSEQSQQANYQLLSAELLPHVEPYQAPVLDNAFIQQLYQHLITLSTAKPVYQTTLLSAIEKNMCLNEQLSIEQNHLLGALRYVLNPSVHPTLRFTPR